MPEKMTVLVTGTPADGFRFYGPVTPNDPALERFTDRTLRDTYWWYCVLEPLPSNAHLKGAPTGNDGALAKPNWKYPLYATCAVCGEELQFDVDPGGTPGRNGDWGADGDYGCITGDGNGCDGHTPDNIRWDALADSTDSVKSN